MRELTSTEIKAEELKILLEVDIFCKEHNIRYYLVGGTLLGAIRHRGFIPWDDDIDICMPRPDYERFIRTFSSDKGLMVLNKYWNNFTFPYSKVINQRYICDLTYDNSTGNRYIWIDVFPIDGLPHELDTVRAIYRKEDYYRKVLMLNTARLGQGRSGLRMIAKFFLKPFALLYGADRVVKKMEKIASMYKYEDYEYVGCIVWGLYGIGERMPKSEFEKAVEVEFEGHQFPAFSCWDDYLKGLYNDYMEIPPENKRGSHEMKVYEEEQV